MPIPLPPRPGGWVGRKVIIAESVAPPGYISGYPPPRLPAAELGFIAGRPYPHLAGKVGRVVKEGITPDYLEFPPNFGVTLLVEIPGYEVWLRPSQVILVEER